MSTGGTVDSVVDCRTLASGSNPGLPESVCEPTLFRYGLRGKIHKLVKSVIDS